MPYLSLYRRYRPQTFAEVVGQEHVTTTLARAVDDGRPHHAYLFTGPRGTGKTSTARILAKSLNCAAGPTSMPDGTCGQCEAITNGSSVDVIEIDAASHGGVDDVRDLRDRVAFAPASARTKVYIVDECHMLSTAGWNAFLKTVEEPPGHVVFVFATTEPHKVLPTILSRTQRFDFRRVPADLLGEHCRGIGEREGLTFEPGALDLVVRAGDGSVRDTLSVLEQVVAFGGTTVTLESVGQVLGAVPDELLIETTDAVAAGDVARVCTLVQRLADAGVDLRQFSRDLIEHLRSLLLLSVAPQAGLVEATPERLTRLTAQAGHLGQVELLRAVELLADAQAQMRRGNTRLSLEVALIKAALPDACGDPAAIAARIDRLERRTGVGDDGGAPPAAASRETPRSAAPAAASGPVAATDAAVDPPAGLAPGAELAPPDATPVTQPAAQPADPAAAVQPVDVDLVRSSWPAVLDAVKARKLRLHAYLNEGQPVAVGDGALTVAFRPGYGFHADEVAGDEWRDLFADVFRELFGVALRVRSVVGDAVPAPAQADPSLQRLAEQAADVAESEAAEAAGEAPDEATLHRNAVETLQRELGARVVED